MPDREELALLSGAERENSLTQLRKSTIRTHLQIPLLHGLRWQLTPPELGSALLCAECPSGHSFSSPALSRGVGAWGAAWTGRAGLGILFGTSATRAAPHRDSCRTTWAWCLLAATLKQRPQPGQGAPSPAMAGDSSWGVLQQQIPPHLVPTPPPPPVHDWKWNANMIALSSCWTGDKRKCFRNTRWSMQQPELLITDSVLSIFIYLMWVIVAGAAFQGEGLKYCSCCCYKGYLIFFHN